jgi:chromate transport protein ChrA
MGLMFIVVIASAFYYIGNNDYHNKGWLLAILSVIFSLAGLFSPLSLIGAFAANLLLYVLLLVYNMFRKKPPGSQSGW